MNPVFEAIARAMGASPKPALVEAAGTAIDPDEDLFRRITGRRRDLTPIETDRARQVSLYLYRRNPMAHRLVDMVVDFVVGDDFTISSSNERVEGKLQTWWSDPVMQLDLRHRDIVRDLLLTGELAAELTENPVSGNVRLGFMDVDVIDKVELDPRNVLVDKTLWVRTENTGEPRPIPLVVYDDVTDPARPAWVGEGFYFGWGRVMGQSRGVPFLLAIADYLDGYDQLLFNALERSALVNAFVWDVTVQGKDDAELDAYAQKRGAPPPPGTVNMHNPGETWQAITPDLGSEDTVTLGRAIKNMGLGGAGFPEAWFAEGDSANRATLAAQGDPTYRMLANVQRYVRAMFERWAKYQVERWKARGMVAAGKDIDVRVNAPDLSAKDTSGISAALPQVANAIIAALGERLIDTKSARRIFISVVNQLGMELDEDEVEAAVDAEEEEAAAAEDLDRTESELRRAAGLPPAGGAPQPPVPAPGQAPDVPPQPAP